jgi:hypothetical protein
MSRRKRGVIAVIAALALAVAMPGSGMATKGGTPNSTKPCPTDKHKGKHKGASNGKKNGSGKGKKCGHK